MTSKMEDNFKLVHPNKTSNVLHFPFAFKFPAKNSEFFRIIYLNFPPKKNFQKNLDTLHTTHNTPKTNGHPFCMRVWTEIQKKFYCIFAGANICTNAPIIAMEKQGRCNEGFNAEPIAFAFCISNLNF